MNCRQVPCESCGGFGEFRATQDMLSDAGIPREMVVIIRCESCQGDGWVAETDQQDQENRDEKRDPK